MAEPEVIPDFTPAIRTDYQSPYIILQMQTSFLKKKTGGVLDALVDLVEADTGDGAQVTFDIQAPVLNYRERVLTVTYKSAFLPYPANVQAFIKLKPDVGSFEMSSITVDSQEKFQEVLQQLFWSKEMSTLCQSLIAKTNEKRTPRIPTPPTVLPSPFQPPRREATSKEGQNDTEGAT